MRNFFKSELEILHIKTGLQQYFKLSELPDAEKQIKILLDSLEIICQDFPYIPDDSKKRIIQENIIRDQEFTSLNSRVIWKWLNANKDKYYRGQNHYEEINHMPASPEIAEKYLKQFRESLEKVGNPETAKGESTGNKLKKQFENIECKHPVEAIIEISETEKRCLDCGTIL